MFIVVRIGGEHTALLYYLKVSFMLFYAAFMCRHSPISGIGVGRHKAKHGGKHLLKQLGGNVQNGRLEGLLDGCEFESETVDIGERLLNN